MTAKTYSINPDTFCIITRGSRYTHHLKACRRNRRWLGL